MEATKTTNVYYYQIFPSDEYLPKEEAESLLKIMDSKIFAYHEEVFHNIAHSDGYISIYDIKEIENRYILGTFVYNQTSNIPPSYDPEKNKPSKLKIGDYDGLGYDSSFIYDRTTRILGLESKKPGTSPSSVLKFLIRNFELPHITLKDVVLPDEYVKFLNSNEYTRIEMDLAIPNNDMGILKPNEKNAYRLLELMQDLKGANAKVVISNGRSRKNKLSLQQVRQLAQWFYKSDKGEDLAKNLRITGIDVDSDHTHVFDLISNRLITQLTIKKTRTIGNFQIKSKYEQLKKDFIKNRNQLELLQK
ncbi:DUF6731 family protein [Hyunsoonleella pacifica]|uniref:DUF4747 family protein n=1 Tax=Hyunsoonleella pacifica TaxID=1080224 RepID=A0A4Q9FN59_9FLAO|nr:DUF6731 family protein [Hyunsoonleella pacifica]TBN15671.1 hypothetical protein EYD46_11140 [Hyunsoonleella pacifica]GGD21704.1 hypothetical protein GCM10011368_24660 [Hyunsoonleella pacifica]